MNGAFETARQRFEAAVRGLRFSPEVPQELAEGIRYALSRGKRLRPVLLLLTADEYGVSEARAMPFALATECIHTASLIHDDLPALDNDSVRRGQASNHAVYGEAKALIQGDALLNYAYELLIESARDPAAIRAAAYLARAAGAAGMLGGQYLDISSEGVSISEETLSRLIDGKTASLFRATFAVGAILGGAAEEELCRIEEAAAKLGFAFQIADDLTDAGFGSGPSGKTDGKDAAAQKNTFVTVFGAARAYAEMSRLLTEAERAGKDAFSFFSDLCRSIGDGVRKP